MKSLICACLVLICSAFCKAQELTVAAAADLRPAVEQIAKHFESASGVKLRVSYGSSGNFYQQLQNGAPFDVFLSANVDYPKRLLAAGLIVNGSYYEFARGGIVLLVRSKSTLDLKAGLRVLTEAKVAKIAVADPGHAPYGQAAIAALKSEALYEKVQSKLVTGENISQAASFVLSGAADAGIVAKSLALSPAATSQVRFVEIPLADYPPLLQAMVLLKSSKNRQGAAKFESFIRGSDAKQILKQFGFEVPDDER